MLNHENKITYAWRLKKPGYDRYLRRIIACTSEQIMG